MRQWQQQSTSEQSRRQESDLNRISIPKIGLDAVIVEGTTISSLALGPGHLLTTALPGESGNAVIAGHRDTFFRHLYELAPGDAIFVRRHGNSYHYIVSSKRVVDADDLSVLRTTSRSILTVITCFPSLTSARLLTVSSSALVSLQHLSRLI
jgi:sortase A